MTAASGDARARVAAVLAIAAASCMLLWPALYNGVPLIYSDSTDYIAIAREPTVRWIRMVGYGWLIAPLITPPVLWAAGLWALVAAQALMIAWLCRLALRVLAPRLARPLPFLAVMAALAAFTAVPWFASLLMADVLTAPMLLAIVLLATGGAALSRAERVTLFLVLVASASAHLTHVPVALGAIAALAAVRLLRRDAPVAWRPLIAATAALPLALALDVAVVWAGTGRMELAAGTRVLAAAPLVAGGLVQETLTATCPHPGWTLCADIAQLPQDNDEFLWNPASPVWRNGDFFRLEGELGEIVRATLARHWPRVLANAIARGARQFVSVGAGDGTDSYLARAVTIRFGIVLGPEVEAAIRAGRQVREEPAAWPPARLPGPIALGAMAALAALMLLARLSRPALIALAAALVAAAAVNALVVGLGSGVHDRYQARIAWLFPFALIIALAGRGPAPAYASRT